MTTVIQNTVQVRFEEVVRLVSAWACSLTATAFPVKWQRNRFEAVWRGKQSEGLTHEQSWTCPWVDFRGVRNQ
jgi:hypothetical protein